MIGKYGKGKALGNRQGNKKSFRANAGGKEKDLRGPISRIKPSPRYPSDFNSEERTETKTGGKLPSSSTQAFSSALCSWVPVALPGAQPRAGVAVVPPAQGVGPGLCAPRKPHSPVALELIQCSALPSLTPPAAALPPHGIQPQPLSSMGQWRAGHGQDFSSRGWGERKQVQRQANRTYILPTKGASALPRAPAGQCHLLALLTSDQEPHSAINPQQKHRIITIYCICNCL